MEKMNELKEMEKINPFKEFCRPATIFLVLIMIDLAISIYYKKTNASISQKSTLFVFGFLCAIGWSFLIDFTCKYEQTVAWILSIIPFLILAFKKK